MLFVIELCSVFRETDSVTDLEQSENKEVMFRARGQG